MEKHEIQKELEEHGIEEILAQYMMNQHAEEVVLAYINKIKSDADKSNKEYKEIPYTIQTNFDKGVVWLNNFVSKERIVITEKDAQSIANAFKLIKAEQQGLL